MCRQVVDHRQHRVRGRTDVEAYLFVDEAVDQRGVLDRTDAVLDAVGAERVQRAAHAGRSGEFTSVRRAEQPRGPGDVERLRERLGWVSLLVVGEAEGDHPPAGVTGGQSREVDRARRVAGAVGGEHQARRHPGAGRGSRDRVERDLEDLLLRSQPLAMVGQEERRLDVDRTGGGGIVERLVEQAREILRGPQHLAGGHVHLGEHAEAAEAADDRDGHAVPVGQFGQRGRAHPALEVQVQMRLRERGEVTDDGHPGTVGKSPGPESRSAPRTVARVGIVGARLFTRTDDSIRVNVVDGGRVARHQLRHPPRPDESCHRGGDFDRSAGAGDPG